MTPETGSLRGYAGVMGAGLGFLTPSRGVTGRRRRTVSAVGTGAKCKTAVRVRGPGKCWIRLVSSGGLLLFVSNAGFSFHTVSFQAFAFAIQWLVFEILLPFSEKMAI